MGMLLLPHRARSGRLPFDDTRTEGAMEVKVDGAGHAYIEFAVSDDEQVRVTYIPHRNWAGGPTIRIQKHAHTGRLSPGPEFPAAKAMTFIAAVSELATRE